MNYQKIYQSLTKSRQEIRESTRCVGFELHHIVPKCMGGSNEKENLVLLTYREHFIAHWLLTKIYPDNPKVHYGFLCMVRDPHGDRKLTSRMVETIKKNYSEFKKWHSKINNPGRSETSRDAARKRMTERNPNQGGATNHTAYPVEVTFSDGRVETFEYMKQVSEKLNVPYSSLKVANRNRTEMRKYNIKGIKKI
jgi:hypothetical protein